MGAARLVSTNTGLGHASARLPARKAMRAGRGERSAKRLRVTIVLALFIALVATALLVGRAVIAGFTGLRWITVQSGTHPFPF